MRALLLTLSLVCLAPAPAPARAGAPAASHPDQSASGADAEARPRWHLPRKRDRGLARDAPAPAAPDWNPLGRPARTLRDVLRTEGLQLDLDLAFYDEQASETITGDENLGSFAWQGTGDWEFVRREKLGKSYVQWTFLGSPGLGYDTHTQTLSGNVGSISGLNANIFPDPAALDELFFKHVSPDQKLIVAAGRIDPSFYFDTNRAANDGFRQFFAFALENNLSIPFPTFGGLGALLRIRLRKDLYVMAAASDSAADEPWAFWQSVGGESWLQLVEVGLTRMLPALGKGHYRITPWHNHLSGEDGFGIGLNFDQELGLDRLVAFFRFGIGNDDVTPVERFVSGGLAFERPFGRKGDAVSLGVAWSDPSPGSGARDETLLELVYRLELSPSIALTPDLQIVLDPANNARNDHVLVGGVRLLVSF